MKNTADSMSLPDMPFYWRIKSSIEDVDPVVPARMDYKFGFDKELNLVTQERNEHLLDVLHKMYEKESNIGFLQDGHNLSAGYGEDFLDFLFRNIKGLEISSIAEIGCGGCFLLEKLKNKGYEVIGIDPSPIAINEGDSRGIEIVAEFFPTEKFQFKSDLIFHVDVFEHVSEPVDFLSSHKNHLNERGYVCINVPDCSYSIENGDISIASHQHLNSFDELSLFNTVQAAGMHVVTIEKSNFGGSLYCLASVEKPAVPFVPNYSEKNAADFLDKAQIMSRRFTSKVNQLLEGNSSVGFYMPMRAIPYLALLGKLDGVRVFDDIEHWHNGYIDGLNIPIENFDDLRANPVDHLVVMSLTFGDLVKEKIEASGCKTKVFTLREILDISNAK